MKTIGLGLGVSLLAAAALAVPAQAASFSFTGSLDNPNDLEFFEFTLASPETVTLRTWSYAGGTNAAGATFANGGFDPIVALYSATGAVIDENDDGGSLVDPDPVTTANYDSFISATLDAGTYKVSLTTFANFLSGANLSDGFTGGGSYNGRENFWALDLINVTAASQVGAVPEAATWGMMIAGFGLAGWQLRRRRNGLLPAAA